jgi:hypothetical protein
MTRPLRTIKIRDIGGNAEVAEICGVTTQAVSNWVARWEGRSDRPAPVARLATGPVWDLDEIRVWSISAENSVTKT